MNAPNTPTLPCLCASFRRASRALTQLYDEALRPHGLRATQFTILQALSLAGEVTQGELGRMLAMDSTTLTRTLDIMVRRGWVTRQHGHDRREWRLSLSRKGAVQFQRALPHWEKVQTQLRNRMGDDRWDGLFKLTNEITLVATE
jgi:DNA-binding MarR family transcriptional regulator